MAVDPDSRPPSPSRPDSPNLFANMGISLPFDPFVREDTDWSSAFTLFDTLETYFDSGIDLLQRNLTKHTDKLKLKAETAITDVLKRHRPTPEALSENFEREVQKFRMRVSSRMASLNTAWKSAKIVRTREKVSFFYGVMSVLFSALLFGLAPDWVHIAYTLQAAVLTPIRVYSYKKRMWHYFLFDLCYYVNIINLVYIWILPQSAWLFVACYCLSHGSVASAVITWRNSLVFHDVDKVISIFVHMYPPFAFTVIRHFYPNAEERFPALKELPHLQAWRALLLSSIIYLVWQLLYWKLVYVDRKTKVDSGQRTTSLSFLLNNQRGLIGRALAATRPERRAIYFMGGQFLYAVLTEIPPVFLLYDSPLWSGAFLILIFGVSVWNGGAFYVEVFGRKFERELEALRRELAEANSRSARSSPTLAASDMSTPVSPILEPAIPNGAASPPLLSQNDFPSEVPPLAVPVPAEEGKKDQ
ncbi:hypothetical protein EVG20_g8054 [Dentipellis fragilis]|uniref:Glycerophosphocholine acyltransferase 1 n=1 Tax=Dentipellis fragilis TaxID=205917 RepID=A0A4Y9Y9I7_9AGAM|nr:hypothetical protein EVG20_g8054 [Dentipellis fragilis]